MGRPVGARGGQQDQGKQPEPARQSGAGDQARDGEWQACLREGGKRSPAQQQGENERGPAECADSAVAHDLELAIPRPSAAEPVRRIGEPVFVKGAGCCHQNGQSQTRGDPGWQQHTRQPEHKAGRGGDDPAGHRQQADRPREVGHGMGRGFAGQHGNRQARIEPQAGEKIGQDMHVACMGHPGHAVEPGLQSRLIPI